MKRLFAICVIAVAALAACGGDSESGADEFCTEFERVIDLAGEVGQSPEDIEKTVTETIEATQAMADALPSDQADLKDNLTEMAEIYGEIAVLLENAGWDPTKVDEAATQEVAAKQGELSETQTQLTDYAQENCDVDLGPTGETPQDAPQEVPQDGSGTDPAVPESQPAE
jgi:ABC-type glycerol-3-phosphate transport system substrate-binding protein